MPTNKEYVRYLRKLGEHCQCEPATLSEDQLRAYFLFLRQEKPFGGSAMKLAGCALRAFFRDGRHVTGWTVFEERFVTHSLLAPGSEWHWHRDWGEPEFRNGIAAL